ncbi:SAM-dependent methyltransferase [Chloroflexota bacterium]
MGAGKGLLADNILAYLPHLAQGFSESVTLVAIERNSASVLQGDLKSASEWPIRGIPDCILSNELLDAFPVHRVIMLEGRLLEVFITLDGDKFIETLDEPSTPMLEAQLSTERITLGNGYSTEINLNIDQWMEGVAHSLKAGYLLTIDYGYPAEDFYSPQRRNGTLMTYCRHTQGNDPFLHIGYQDITTHVDFTSVILSGERRGFEFVALTTQREFCYNLGLDFFMKSLERQGLSYSEYNANRSSILELVRHEGMGGFSVLIQSKGLPQIQLYGFTRYYGGKTALHTGRELPVPLLAHEHIPLLQSRYPHLMDFDTDCFNNEDNG